MPLRLEIPSEFNQAIQKRFIEFKDVFVVVFFFGGFGLGLDGGTNWVGRSKGGWELFGRGEKKDWDAWGSSAGWGSLERAGARLEGAGFRFPCVVGARFFLFFALGRGTCTSWGKMKALQWKEW